MFDEYEPKPEVTCPYCGKTLKGWQGKDGPCGLFVWRQGLAAPVKQKVDEECRLSDEKLAECRLPETFRFAYAEAGCRDCPVGGIGRTENQIWVETTLILLRDAPFSEQVDSNDARDFSPHIWRRSGDAFCSEILK